MKYDIFISYRRVNGAQYARIIQLMLIQRGYNVFLDYDELKDGIFSNKIKKAIQSAPIFMLILSKDSLERCENENDWLRQEIQFAQEFEKHIIPVNADKTFMGVKSPNVPKNISDFALCNQQSEIDFGSLLAVSIDKMITDRIAPIIGVRISQTKPIETYDLAIETLRQQDKHNRFIRKITITGIIALIVIILATCCRFILNDIEENENEKLDLYRTEIETKYEKFDIKLNPDLTLQQLNIIDTICNNMIEVKPDSLWFSKYEFTVGEWYGLMEEPYDMEDKFLPITDVSYGETQFFIEELSELIGKTETSEIQLRLPTEEEWEFAALGGYNNTQNSVFNETTDNYHNSIHFCDGQSTEPNNLDIYDMDGNISEMSITPFNETSSTACGGNYSSPKEKQNILSRYGANYNQTYPTIGFRLIISKE